MKLETIAGLMSAVVWASGCYCSHEVGPDAATPVDAASQVDAAPEPLAAESSFYSAASSSGDAHLVRVYADGELLAVGPPLREADPPIERVGRLLQAPRLSRVFLQDNGTGRTHALRGGRWVDVCAEWPSTGCYVSSARSDLSRFILVRGYLDEGPGPADALFSYDGEQLVAASGQRVVFSDRDWSVLAEPDAFVVVWDDGRRTTLERRAAELLAAPLDHRFMTYGRDDGRVWIRDPDSGERIELACPDADPLRTLSAPSLRVRCGQDILRVSDEGLVSTGHRMAEAPRERILHLQQGGYTAVVDALRDDLVAALRVLDPMGDELAIEFREFLPLDSASYALATVHGQRFEEGQFHLYLSFEHYRVMHDDLRVEQHDGVLSWDSSDGLSWFPVPEEDTRASRVWFPESQDRAFWVTRDGRLLSFDYAAVVLEDLSGEWTFGVNY